MLTGDTVNNNYFKHKSNLIKCRFLMREENWSTWGKTSQSRVENQQTQPTYDTKSGNRTWATLVGGECSHRYVTTALPARCLSDYHCKMSDKKICSHSLLFLTTVHDCCYWSMNLVWFVEWDNLH